MNSRDDTLSPHTQQPKLGSRSLWKKSKHTRWLYYLASMFYEGLGGFSYLFGYGGGNTVFGLGVAATGIFTIATCTIAAGALTGIAMLFQAYLLKLNEEKFRTHFDGAITKQYEHIASEEEMYRLIKQRALRISDEAKEGLTASEMHANYETLSHCYRALERMQSRLAIYQSQSEDEEEVTSIRTATKPRRDVLENNIKALQESIQEKTRALGLDKIDSSLKKIDSSSISTTQQNDSDYNNKKEAALLLKNTVFSFLLCGAIVLAAITCFATPAGWIALALTLVGTGLCLYAERANRKIDKKASDVEALDNSITPHLEVAKQECLAAKNDHQSIEKLLKISQPAERSLSSRQPATPSSVLSDTKTVSISERTNSTSTAPTTPLRTLSGSATAESPSSSNNSPNNKNHHQFWRKRSQSLPAILPSRHHALAP